MAEPRAPHPEAILLFPIDLASNSQLTIDLVSASLYRLAALSTTVPYKWGFIDRPKDNDVFCIHHRGGPLTDGLMYLEQEHRHIIPRHGHGPDIECLETKQGFIPNHDNQAFRIRRRFHFVKPHGNPSLFLVAYQRSQTPVPVAAHLHQHIRHYPLPPPPPVHIFLAGPRAGEAIHDEEARTIIANVQSRAPESYYNQQRTQAFSHPGGPAAYGGVAQDISAHTAALKELERKKRMAAAASRRDEDDSADEDTAVSVRTLALSRYKRNHEFMEEVFQRAAFGARKVEATSDSTPGMTLEEILAKLESTQASVDEMEKRLSERQRLQEEREEADRKSVV